MGRFISPLTWVGGKAKQFKLIKSFLPTDINWNDKQTAFFDIFTGGGSVALNMEHEFPNICVYAFDIDKDLIDFYQNVSNIDTDMLRKFLNHKDSEAIRTFYNSANKETKYFLDNCLGYGGFNGSTWTELRLQQNFSKSKLDRLDNLKKSRVSFMNKEYDYSIDNAISMSKQSKNVFVFLDPPYFYNQKTKVYKYTTMDFKHFKNKVDELNKAGIKFLMTIDNSPEIRELFKDYELHDEEWKYSSTNVNSKTLKTGKELFITNYKVGNHE